MALDSSGNVYLTGSTTSTALPMAGSPFQKALVTTATTAGTVGTDAFIIKFSPNGQGTADLVYSTYLGGSDLDQGNAIDVDASGAIYVVGTTRSGDFPCPLRPMRQPAGCHGFLYHQAGPRLLDAGL